MTYAWIPIVLWAALAQTARNAAQRSLVAQAGTLGATLARFLYGLPFAAAWVLLLHAWPATAAPVASASTKTAASSVRRSSRAPNATGTAAPAAAPVGRQNATTLHADSKHALPVRASQATAAWTSGSSGAATHQA